MFRESQDCYAAGRGENFPTDGDFPIGLTPAYITVSLQLEFPHSPNIY